VFVQLHLHDHELVHNKEQHEQRDEDKHVEVEIEEAEDNINLCSFLGALRDSPVLPVNLFREKSSLLGKENDMTYQNNNHNSVLHGATVVCLANVRVRRGHIHVAHAHEIEFLF